MTRRSRHARHGLTSMASVQPEDQRDPLLQIIRRTGMTRNQAAGLLCEVGDHDLLPGPNKHGQQLCSFCRCWVSPS